MRLLIISTYLLLALSGCAAAPETVQPITVSQDAYRALSCSELSAEKQRVALAVSDMSLQQEKARSADTVGVLLLFMPLGSMSGKNREADLAQLKGQAVAVDQVRAAKACP